MKRNYFTALLILCFGLFLSDYASAQQLHAENDFADIVNGSETTVVINDVLANDTLNNLPVTLSQVSIQQTSSSSPNFILNSNGSVSFLNGPVNMGTYTINYYISSLLPPFMESNEATVFLNVGCAQVPVPTVTLIQPTCDMPGIASITFTDVTPGAIIRYGVNGGVFSNVISTGSNTVLIQVPGSWANTVIYQAIDGQCSSDFGNVTINPSFGIGLDITGTYVDQNANGYTDVGDVIHYAYAVTNQGCGDLTNINVNNNGFTIVGGPLASLAGGMTDSTTFTATYIITQENINQGYVFNSAYVLGSITNPDQVLSNDAGETIQLNISNGIKLEAFIDSNGNGTKDSGEQPFENRGNFNYEINNDGTVHHILANQPAYYLFESDPTNSYDISFTVDSDIAAYYTIAPATHNDITVANNSGITTYSFAVTAVPYSDIYVNLYPGPAPRPGFQRTAYIYYGNRGNMPLASGTLTFTKDDAESILNISVPGTTAAANGFTYDFTNLLPNQHFQIAVTLRTATIPTVALGDMVTTSASITLPAGDILPLNNNSTVNQIIIGSFDPNEKTESHGGKVLFSTFTADDYLTYTIHFENTGTANAINVSVTDALDNQLDATSVKMVNASHNYTLDRVGNNLTWKFDGIDLPPSAPNTTSGPGHGWLIFQVKPKLGFELNDVIPNIANIYFDFNPAIVTDPCITQFVNTLNTHGFAFDQFKYYPNSVKNNLTISNNNTIDSVEITSILGQKVMDKNINALSAELDLSSLAKGIYLLKAKAKEQEKIIKIIKE